MTSETIHVFLNGIGLAVAPGTTLASVVTNSTSLTTGIAVALNSEVIPKSAWATQQVVEDDVIDLVTAKQGG